MNFLLFGLSWALLASQATAKLLMPTKYSEYEMAYYTCSGIIGATAAVCPMAGKYGYSSQCICGQDSGFGTMANCLVKGYDNSSEIIDGFITTCAYSGIIMTKETFYQNYTRTQLMLVNTSTIANFNVTKPVTFPVAIDMVMFRKYDDSYRFYLNNYNLSIYFGSGLLGYWALVLLIAAIVNWSIRLFPRATSFFVGPISNTYRRMVTLPAAIRRKKTTEQKMGIFDCLIPSRMETIICVGFLAMTVAMLSAQIKPVAGGSIMYPNYYGELGRYLGDRSGIVVSFVVPLLVLFAGRNNFLQWLTRWNFATFITFHRWVSRVVILVVFLHAIAFTVSDKKSGKYKKRMKKPFMNWGVVACLLGAIILVQGMMYLRRKNYETFILIHIIFALFFIVGAYKHTVILGYGAFYWATVAVWALDRVVRIARLVSFGARTATVTMLADETLKIVVPKPKYWKSIPGGHAFIHFLRPTCFWQSHPFTFVNLPTMKDSIVLYVKIKGGVTHGLSQHLLNSPGCTAKIKVCIEGPYGEASSARQYKNAVFIAGGNGIPGIYSECTDLATRQNDKQSLKLIWVIREWKSISWFFDELKQLENTKVQATVYVTRPELMKGVECCECHLQQEGNAERGQDEGQYDKVPDEKSSDDKTCDEKCFTTTEQKDSDTSSEEMASRSIVNSLKSRLSHVNFHEGRPNVADIVEQEIIDTDGSLAFVTCGHPVMVDDIRYSIVRNLHKSKYRTEYFEQLQVWA